MKKKQKKPRKIEGRDPTSQLYRAVMRYIESHGGKLLFIGGVQVEEWPGDGAFKFVLGVRCMGRKPTKEPKRG